jgi:hypothetical protein
VGFLKSSLEKQLEQVFVVVRRRRDSAVTPEEREFCQKLLCAMYATCASIPAMLFLVLLLFAIT